MKTTLMALLSLLVWFGIKAQAEPLELGAALPAVIVPDENGTPVSLAEAGATGYTLVYFYPKAGTGGCTAQACSLRDAYATLQEKGVAIYGVSTDTPQAQKAFKDKEALPFTLLADTEGKVVEAFGVPRLPVVGLAKRQAFLFRDGKLVWRDLSASTREQADDVLKAISASGN